MGHFKAIRTIAALVLATIAGSSRVLSQISGTAASPATGAFAANAPPSTNQAVVIVPSLLSSFDFWLSVIILMFGSFTVVVEYLLIRRMPDAKPDDALKLFVVTFIIVGTLIFVAAGFGASQIAPAAGLFGTIAGYLLGKESGPRRITDDRATGASSGGEREPGALGRRDKSGSQVDQGAPGA